MKQFLTVIGLAVILLTSCSKDNGTSKKLEGKWDATSATWSGVELLGPDSSFLINSITYEFKSPDGAMGSYTTTSVSDKGTADESISIVAGSYEVSEKGEMIKLTDAAGTVEDDINANFTLDGDTWSMSFTDNTGSFVIKAKKQ